MSSPVRSEVSDVDSAVLDSISFVIQHTDFPWRIKAVYESGAGANLNEISASIVRVDSLVAAAPRYYCETQ